MVAKRRPTYKQVGWVPPGHVVEDTEVVDRLTDLVDLQDPARLDIIRTLLDLAELEIELTSDVVERAIRVGRRRYADRQTTDGRRDSFRPLSSATIEAATRAVVYYMRIGNRVKIGFTTKLADRLKAINPEELLALEPGGYELERERHAQFSKLRVHGEWFRLEEPLSGWIRHLQGPDVSVSA